MKQNIITRVHATQEKISLLQEMQTMINTLKKQSARIESQIDKMIKADLESMEAEREALTEMEQKIKSNGTDKKTGTTRGTK